MSIALVVSVLPTFGERGMSGGSRVPEREGANNAAAAMQRAPTHMIHVNAQSPSASDSNPGTETLPVKTIGRAALLSTLDNARGIPVTVLVHPGVYREGIALPPGGTNAPLTFRGTEIGKAVISGSDVWTGWIRRGRGAYGHSWPYTWGLAPVPPGWPTLQAIVRRKEMVFVNGELLTQAMDPGGGSEGAFYVDEVAHLLYIWPKQGADPNRTIVEVAVRDVLFSAVNRANVTLHGLVFQHAATPLDGSAVGFDGMTGLTIEDTTFRWNNWGGLNTSASTNVAVVRSVSNHNGARGMSSWKTKTLRFEDNETSFNDWRGVRGGFTGWAVAGVKLLRLHGGMIRRHKAVGNKTVGFWLDFDNEDVSVEGSFWCDNDGGAFIEASEGPITIERTIICRNRYNGILASVSQRLTVRDTVVYRNGAPQVEVNDTASGTVDNWETGQPITLRTQFWTLCGNAIVGSNDGRDLLSVPDWDFFQKSLRAAHNTYWNPGQTNVFSLRRPLGGAALDLAGWQKISGQDAQSVFADPRFSDPGKDNFTPLPGSPWQKC
jgi:parallel beta helix pectate lyase-like protein